MHATGGHLPRTESADRPAAARNGHKEVGTD